MIVRAATAGFGLGFVMEDQVEAHLADGRLVRVLEDWCPSFPATTSIIQVAASLRLRSRC